MVRYLRLSRPRCCTAKDHANRSGPQACTQADDVGAVRFRNSRRWRPIKVMSGEFLAAWRGRLLVARYGGLRTNVSIAPRYGLSPRETTEVRMIPMLPHRQHFYSVAPVGMASVPPKPETQHAASRERHPSTWVAIFNDVGQTSPIGPGQSSFKRENSRSTFELTGARRRPAVARPVERAVRPHWRLPHIAPPVRRQR